MTNRQANQAFRHGLSVAAFLFAVAAFGVTPCQAQVTVQPPYYQGGYGPQGAYPNQPNYPGQSYTERSGSSGSLNYPLQPGAANMGQTLPEGMDALYALEGTNQLVLFGTKEGYETALEIARNIDGDLDIIRTQFTLVRTTRANLAGLGVTLTGDTLTASDIAKLVAARQAGKLSTLDTLRITTREDTAVDALLGEHQRGALPLTMIPRVAKDGTVEVQLTQPVDTTIASPSGQATVVVLPNFGPSEALPTTTNPPFPRQIQLPNGINEYYHGIIDAPVTLLFVTPAILPSDYRPAR